MEAFKGQTDIEAAVEKKTMVNLVSGYHHNGGTWSSQIKTNFLD
jgi:hypothetical protein